MYTGLSKFLCKVLRHQPELIGITIDHEGYTDVDKLIQGINDYGKTISREILEEIVAEDEKGRYAFNEDHSMICCVQGHSIPIKGTLIEAVPPDFLYHGTTDQFIDSIFQKGLLPMSRNYVHLSKDLETARKVGNRHHKGNLVILEVNCRQMVEDGYSFKIAKNGVWQIKSVPVKYLKIFLENL